MSSIAAHGHRALPGPSCGSRTPQSIADALPRRSVRGRFDPDELREKLRDAAGDGNMVVREGEAYYLTDFAVRRIEAILYTQSRFEEISDEKHAG